MDQQRRSSPQLSTKKKAALESFSTLETDSLSGSESLMVEEIGSSLFSASASSSSSKRRTPNGSIPTAPQDDYTHKETAQLEKLKETLLASFIVSSAVIGGGLYLYLANYNQETFVISLTLEGSSLVLALSYAASMLVPYWLFRKYDRLVQARQAKLLKVTEQSQALVTSLFPEDVHQRLMLEVDERNKILSSSSSRLLTTNKKKRTSASQMHAFLAESERYDAPPPTSTSTNILAVKKTKPIADFFPEATIMFGDLVGFTAWSSMREPVAVFTLLEAIYSEFDTIARQLGVFKVETIGDCYVAVAGLPVKRTDHAVVMCRFASHCRSRLNSLLKELEKTLGPDTADLAMRTGLHSGPVTAGVLRGDRARFQLFGDTMNTTSRLESTGKPGKIHISSETANHIFSSGKHHWLVIREDKVTAKGKGELTTYWLQTTKEERRNSMMSNLSQSTTDSMNADLVPMSISICLPEKHLRLVDWITMELANILKEVGRARRFSSGHPSERMGSETEYALHDLEKQILERSMVPRDEVRDTVSLSSFPESFYHESNRHTAGGDANELEFMVLAELHDYVQSIAQAYTATPFHSFEHASHVTMSVVKLFSRIVPKRDGIKSERKNAHELHETTYGIASDPLAQFTVVLSALIHDVDHPGVHNSQLTKENNPLAVEFDHKSPAEQHSINLAWKLLMEGRFANLRSAIYSTEDDFKRFRQLLVNTVMATDIMDKGLVMQRKERWARAFSSSTTSSTDDNVDDLVNRKATIVMERVIQASDVSHTMQHWHIYRKWNGRLFEEMYKAYLEGRGKVDPSKEWYEGELGFFDHYIIPLARELADCGVFGVCSDEYLNYAEQNRKEWALTGKGIIAGIVESLRHMQRETDLMPPSKRRGSMSSVGRPSRRRASMSSAAPLQSPNTPQLAEDRLKLLKQKLSNSSSSIVEMSSSAELPRVMSVLVVDDDKILRKMFARSVKKIAPGWSIQEAGSGEEALECVANADTDFDLILMDMYMGTDESKLIGPEAVAELRKKGVRSKICGMSANDVEQMFDESGANAFVFKPLRFRTEPLKSELERIWGSKDEWDNTFLTLPSPQASPPEDDSDYESP